MVLERLASHGFSPVADLGKDRNKTLVRVRTADGWVYERFADAAEVDQWAAHHKPEKP